MCVSSVYAARRSLHKRAPPIHNRLGRCYDQDDEDDENARWSSYGRTDDLRCDDSTLTITSWMWDRPRRHKLNHNRVMPDIYQSDNKVIIIKHEISV